LKILVKNERADMVVTADRYCDLNKLSIASRLHPERARRARGRIGLSLRRRKKTFPEADSLGSRQTMTGIGQRRVGWIMGMALAPKVHPAFTSARANSEDLASR
jgi:hypothetical protein